MAVSQLRCIFTFAAPTDSTLRGHGRAGGAASVVPIMLLSASGVSCANFTVSAFDSGGHARAAADVQSQYLHLVKEAVFLVRHRRFLLP